jgi:flavin-dependent dehydrogenase
MRERVDLVVAGAGPSGLAAAIHAARAGMAVTVLDRRGGVIDKACGEGIMPSGVKALERLGIFAPGVPFIGVRYADAVDPQLTAVGTFHHGWGLAIRRTALHAAMKHRAIAAGVRFIERSVESFELFADEVFVNRDLRARWLVAADGLRSPIRRALGVEQSGRSRTRLGLRRHYALAPWTDRVEVYFGEGAEAYVTPVATELVGVAFLFDAAGNQRPSPKRFDDLIRRFPLLRDRLMTSPIASRLRGAGPFEQRVARRVVGNVLLVGDAAGYVDPLTGEGVALGLATSEAAVASLLEGTPEAYERRYQRLTRRLFILTTALLTVTQHRRLHAPLLRAARALPEVFDGVLGLLATSTPQCPSGGERAHTSGSDICSVDGDRAPDFVH